MAGLLTLGTVLLTPVALRDPYLRVPFVDWLEVAVICALRPLALVGRVAAAPAVPPGDAADAAAVRRLRATLERETAGKHARLLQMNVRATLASGGAGLPSQLVLDRRVSLDRARRLAGRPVVSGENLCGFVAPPRRPFDGLLRVDLLNHRPRAAEAVRRLLARAASTRSLDLPELELLVEAARRGDPFALRVCRAVPRHLDTWSPSVTPYLARTVASELLHPDLPAGLVLGRVESFGYEDRSFVLRRFVAPLWDPRSLVRVGILLAAEDPGLPRRGRDLRPHDEPAEVIWRSPRNLGYQRYAVRGPGVASGAGVLHGLRCLGRVLWARQGVGVAAPLGVAGSLLPAIALRPGSTATRAIVLEGLGATSRGARFRLVHPRSLRPGELAAALVFTGVRGRGFPPGRIIGRVVAQAAASIEIALFGRERWPDRVFVPRRGGRP